MDGLSEMLRKRESHALSSSACVVGHLTQTAQLLPKSLC